LRRFWAELTAIRLCTETPTAGARIFETGDENLLRLAHETGSALLATKTSMLLTHGGLVFMESAPVVIVFTKYDGLVRTKEAVLKEENDTLSDDVRREQGKEEAQKAFDECIQSLEHTLRNTNTPTPRHVKVSCIYFPFFIWIRVDLSPQTNRATKLTSLLSLKSLAKLSATT